MNFPHDFTWGVATSSYQIEGAAREDGRGESIWDRFTHTPGTIKDGNTGDVACDHYHRYPEDVALMQSLGLNGYRFSIAWPRVIPAGTGAINQAGLDFYSRLVDALLEAGITPYVTLYHWDLPQALQDRGGWNSRETVDAFVEYADLMTRHLGDRVKHWMTHNEPWCTAYLGHLWGMFAPGIRDIQTTLQVSHHLLLSHGRAVPVMRANLGADAMIGIAPNYSPAYPVPGSANPDDEAAARRHDGFFNRWFLDPLVGRGYPQDMWDLYTSQGARIDVQPGDLDAIAAPLDFLGLNYYDVAWLAHDPGQPLENRYVPNPALERTADREVYPPGMYAMLTRVHRDYNFPALYITENGAALNDVISPDGKVHDPQRTAFLQAHFAQAARAIEDGVPLRGYFIWSLYDNFEWSSGFTLRYGLTYVDFATQQRTVKDSGLWYRDFIRQQKER